ncbi:tRNA-dihydrouridine(20a/20b) synthase [NAD(P)+]-like [Calliphora vicina]|uniref:tRNA-dihydrouridine(20a/20b) synthase [NAD(P)+]-like n=1 Tax=Calliphora vicina TaxID=7373 RepID=UPI00325ACED3
MDVQKQRPQIDILEVFREEKSQKHGFLRVSAPMVRYSKLEFRRLLRKHGVKLCFTPMIIADSFNNSEKARQNEFTTTSEDKPLIAQFAAKDAIEFSNSSQLIYPYVDGIDLNCGCPQSWAIAKGYGCGLLKQPELVKDIIQTIRRRVNENFSVSLKIRLLSHESSNSTIEFARQLEMCGATFLSLHGRTMWQKTSDPLNVAAIREVKDSLRIPLIANGNVKSWQTACELYEQTRADGIMAARGVLANPVLFNPEYKNDSTTAPLDCIQDWLNIAAEAGDNLQFLCFHHHLTFMWGCNLKRKLRLEFNTFTKKQQILDFFYDNYNVKASSEFLSNPLNYTNCNYTHYMPEIAEPNLEEVDGTWNSNTNGKFFNEFKQEMDGSDDDDCDLGSSFFAEM